MDNLYRLKHTLYPTCDDGLTTDKEEYDDSQSHIYRKGSLWYIVSREEYCKLQNYEEEEAEDFMSDTCDFEMVAYSKTNDLSYLLLNSLEDFERAK